MSRTIDLQYSGVPPSDDEAAAITTVLVGLLAGEAAQPGPLEQPDSWRDSGKLVHQGLAPFKINTAPTWARIERLRRHTSGGFYGVVGL